MGRHLSSLGLGVFTAGRGFSPWASSLVADCPLHAEQSPSRVQFGMLVGAGVPAEKPVVLLGAGSVLSLGQDSKGCGIVSSGASYCTAI